MLPKAKLRRAGGLPAQPSPLPVVAASHVDHGLTHDQLDYVLAYFAGRSEFFIDAVELPEHLGTVMCGLHGPSMGDAPVREQEVHYRKRGDRKYESRLCKRAPRPTRIVSVIAGPHEGAPCVLYTAFGGPPAPRELGDPSIPAESLAACERFWSMHALSAE